MRNNKKSSKISSKNFLKNLAENKRIKNNNELSKLSFNDLIDIDDEFSIKSFAGENNENFSIENLKSEKYEKYDNLKFLLESSSSCQISDAIATIINYNGVIDSIKSINGLVVYGLIRTAKTFSDDWGTSLLAIEETLENEIIFIDSKEKIKGNKTAIWGELASKSAMENKILGTIVLGYVRDIDVIKNLDYPIFAKGFVPNAGKPLRNGELDVTLNISVNDEFNSIYHNSISQIAIESGDFIFADDSGVVHIPKNIFKNVMGELLHIKVKELRILRDVSNGKSIQKSLNED
ncbi:MAG: RraA family protein [Methanobrevibacter sp.]|jgi:regulator of RNase E activity RraA|nr:RraA family protein [Candidatus Methanoflexus mossambicus]